jgi:Fe-S cluster biosynthesis and repair protein YggX
MQLGRKEEAAKVLEDGMKLAHRRGEYTPRNQMRDLLASLGVEPPELVAPAAPGEWRCARCLEPNPRLEEAPFSYELGQRIGEEICQRCWEEWMAMSVKVINEYRLNLASPEGSSIYDSCMHEFFGL